MASVETDIAARPTYPPADPPGRMQDSAASGPDSCSLQRSQTLVRNSTETFPRRREGEAGTARLGKTEDRLQVLRRAPEPRNREFYSSGGRLAGPPAGGTRQQFTVDELTKNR